MLRVGIAFEQNWNRVPGGTAISTNRLASALAEEDGVEIVGIIGRHRRSPTIEPPLGLAWALIPFPGRLMQQGWSRGIGPAVDRWLDGIDVVHAPAYVVPPTARPIVVTVHDLAFRHHPEWFTTNGVRFFSRFLERVRDGAMAVAVPSTRTAADCVDAGIEAERIHIVPWGVDATPVADDRIEAIRGELDLHPRSVLFVGTLEPRKNLDGLARALRHVDDHELVVAGPEGWGDVAPPPGARILGRLPDDRVREVMAASRVLAYPSHLEGFGLPVLEAMAVGTPSVVTAGTAAAEVAGDTGIAVERGDEIALAEAIEALLGDDDLHHRLSVAGRRRAAEFTWESAATSMIDVYRAAVAIR